MAVYKAPLKDINFVLNEVLDVSSLSKLPGYQDATPDTIQAILNEDRDQLFAEAVNAYSNGAQWWPDKDFERQHIEPEQRSRYEPDAWEEPIRRYLETVVTETTVTEIASGALFIEAKQLGRFEQNRIAAVLEAVGWKRGKRQSDRRPWVRV
jgi:predicted P-loop ATPase